MVFGARRLPCSRRRLIALFSRGIASAARTLRRAAPEISIAVLGDAAMRRVNRDFHRADCTTDVLAFPLDDAAAGRGRAGAGEVIVCAPFAAREAAARGIPWSSELVLYVVHGTLHLMGEDDRTIAAALRMRRLETRALARLGIRLPAGHAREIDPH